MPRSAEAAIAQSCKCSARYSLEEVGQGTKQTETRTSSPDASPEQRDSILTNGLHSQSIPADRKSAFQLRPAPGGGLWPRLLGAIHNESDPQHLLPTPSPPPRAGSVRARGRQSPLLTGPLHYYPRCMGASGRRAMFCREGRSPRAAQRLEVTQRLRLLPGWHWQWVCFCRQPGHVILPSITAPANVS